jgi:hypothetical protein
MQTKSKISRLFALLYFVGVALLAAGFILLVPPGARTETAWLDFAIVCIVFSINFPLFSVWRMNIGSFNAKIPTLGLLALCDLIYICLALWLMSCGGRYGLTFRMQLVGQMALLFVVATVVTIAWWSSAHVVEVTEEEKATRSALEKLKTAIDKCVASLSAKAPNCDRERQLLLRLQEDARYLSPSRDASALAYEDKIAVLIDDIRLQFEDGAVSIAALNLDKQFEQCAALMALRKQIR